MREQASHTEQYKGLTIEIHNDSDNESPREWDNLGTMVCFHRRYNLGDKHSMTVEEAKAFVNRKDVISLPLYLYDHSGITMNTTGFSCPWDSGQVGFIYVTKEKIRKEYGVKRNVTKKLIARIIGYLKNEVETYDNFLTGNVYGFKIMDAEGTDIDSCWGFYGDYSGEYGALTEARQIVDNRTHEGTTTVDGQELMPFAQVTA
jgi:hypothetical protein